MSAYYLDIHTSSDYFCKLKNTLDEMKAFLLEKEPEIAESAKNVGDIISSPVLSENKISSAQMFHELYQLKNVEQEDLEYLSSSFNRDGPTEKKKEELQFFIDTLHCKYISAALLLENTKNKFENACPLNKKNKNKISSEDAEFRQVIIDSINVRLKKQDALIKFIEPYISRYERSFRDIVRYNGKPAKIILSENDHGDIYEFYRNLSGCLLKFALINVEALRYYNEMYLLFFFGDRYFFRRRIIEKMILR